MVLKDRSCWPRISTDSEELWIQSPRGRSRLDENVRLSRWGTEVLSDKGELCKTLRGHETFCPPLPWSSAMCLQEETLNSVCYHCLPSWPWNPRAECGECILPLVKHCITAEYVLGSVCPIGFSEWPISSMGAKSPGPMGTGHTPQWQLGGSWAGISQKLDHFGDIFPAMENLRWPVSVPARTS